MNQYKNSFIKLIKDAKYIVPLIIVAIGSFGYLLTHATVNVDVLSSERYFEGTELIAQGRLVGPMIEKIFNVMEFSPFFVDFLAVLFLIVAATLFCTLIEKVTGGKIRTIGYTIFSCLFISYPLMMEIFTYMPMGLSIALGFCFVAVSLILAYEFVASKKTLSFLLSTFLLWCAISLYESFATVYIMGVLTILIVKVLFLNQEKVKLRTHIIEGVKYLIPLVIAIIFNTVITTLVLIILDIPESTRAAKKIAYITMGIPEGIQNLIHTVIINYGIHAFAYLPITILLISSIISIIMGIILSIKKRDISIFVIFLGMNVTLLLLSIVQGGAAPYRTCQQFQLFVAVIFMILIQVVLNSDMKKLIKNLCMFAVFIVIFYQAKDIYQWQYVNDLRFQKEKQDIIAIGNEITSKYNYTKKPVIFVGNYTLSENITERITVKPKSLHYKILNYYNKHYYGKIKDVTKVQYTQKNVQSYINYGEKAFLDEGKPNIELIKCFNLLGYDIKAGEIEMFKEALEMKDIPKWPKEGSIFETDNYIVVHF